jgi:putative heme-binding domain-containing protein
MLEHAIVYALIEIGDSKRTAEGLGSPSAYTRRAALLALDQMPGGNLKPEAVIPLLAVREGTNEVTRGPQVKRAMIFGGAGVESSTAEWVVMRHPEWSGELARFLEPRLASSNSFEASLFKKLTEHFIRNAAVQEAIGRVLDNPSTARETRRFLIQMMAKSGVKETPAAWAKQVRRDLEGTNYVDLIMGVAALRAMPPSRTVDLTAPLLAVARDKSRRLDLRLGALAAMPGGLREVDRDVFDLLRDALNPNRPLAQRSDAATALARARLSDEQLVLLADTTDGLRKAGPLELPRLLDAFTRTTNEAIGHKVIDALESSKAAVSLRPETLKPRLTNFPATVQRRADQLLASFNLDAAQQKARLDELSLNLKSGDVRRGQAIFNSQKAACATCHAIGYLGGNLGPDLTRIGQIRTERDLLEAVVFPNASFVRSYEPMLVVTKSGDEHSGVLRRDAPDEVVLATGVGAEVRLARTDIAEMRPGAVSVMPAGLDEQITRQELADLLAFLKATKW